MVRFSVDRGADELVSSLLWDAGTTGILELDGALVAGFDDRATAEAVADRATEWPATVLAIEPTEWTGGDEVTTVTIRPDGPGSKLRPRRLSIVAGSTFGHGGHPTTVLAIDHLSEVVAERHATASPVSMLDVGTGSGVLAIAAAALGADPVVAIDIDPEAATTARANAARNRVDVIVGEAPIDRTPALVGRTTFDLVVANVLLPVHRELAPAMAAILAPGGSLVTAGYLDGDGDEVVELHRASIGSAAAGPVAAVVERRRDGWLGHRFELAPRP